MRYIKRAVSLFMVLTILVVFSGCSAGSKEQAAKKLDIESETSITVWYNDQKFQPYLEVASKEFHEANELVTINPVYVSSEDYLEEIYNESVKNNNAPDLFLMSSDYVEKAYLMGLMLENNSFDDLKLESVFGDAAITACSYHDKLYGYPVSFNTAFMVYNTKYTNAVDTFSQLTQYSDNYQVTDDNSEIEVVATWDVSSMFLNYAFAGSYITYGGDDSEDNTKIVLDDDKIKQALNEYVKLKSEYGIVRSEINQNMCVDMFSNNKLLYTIIDSNHLAAIDKSGVSYDICKIPALNDQLESHTMSTTTMAVVNPYSSKTTIAKAVARAFSYDYANVMKETSGYMCARGDYNKKDNSSAYKNLHKLYSDSTVKAKYVGIGDLYMRYEIMLHQIWDGSDVNTSYDIFKTNIDKLN